MNDEHVQNASGIRLSGAVALVLQATTRSHLLKLFSPFIQILRVFGVVRRGALGVHIFQIAFPAHTLPTPTIIAMFKPIVLENSVP